MIPPSILMLDALKSNGPPPKEPWWQTVITCALLVAVVIGTLIGAFYLMRH